jgi:hypothetical protein
MACLGIWLASAALALLDMAIGPYYALNMTERWTLFSPFIFGPLFLGFGVWNTLDGESGTIWFVVGAAWLLLGLFQIRRRRV